WNDDRNTSLVAPNTHTPAAATVPDNRPQNPAQGVIRRQNMPRMNGTKTGAWKNENSVCRYSSMLLYPAAMKAVRIPTPTPRTVTGTTRPTWGQRGSGRPGRP